MVNYVRQTAPSVTWQLPFVFNRALYSIPLWPKESGHLSPVRDSADLFVPAGWINPFTHIFSSITKTYCRTHPIEHTCGFMCIGYTLHAYSFHVRDQIYTTRFVNNLCMIEYKTYEIIQQLVNTESGLNQVNFIYQSITMHAYTI